MSKLPSLLLGALLTVLAASSFAQPASAPAAAGKGAAWGKSHPRRAEVDTRLANQNKRIHQQVAEGDMSKAQAAKLHKQDRKIRQEERDMASQNGGRITKGEQRVLNQQENKVSRQIGK